MPSPSDGQDPNEPDQTQSGKNQGDGQRGGNDQNAPGQRHGQGSSGAGASDAGNGSAGNGSAGNGSGSSNGSGSGNGSGNGGTNAGGQGTPDPNGDPMAYLQQMFDQLGLSSQLGGADLGQILQQFGMGGAPTAGGPMGVNPLGFQSSANRGTQAGTTQRAESWQQLKHLTRQMVSSSEPDPTPTQAQISEVVEADRLAQMWLDKVTDFPALTTSATAWSRAEWVEATFEHWRPVVEPVVSALARALADQAPADMEVPENDPLGAITAMLAPMMEQLAQSLYSFQFAQAIAQLSGTIASATDMGFQLADRPRVALLPANITKAFGELEQPHWDVVLFLTLREAARQRLFRQVGWLGPQLLAYIEHYASHTRIDLGSVEDLIGDQFASMSPDRIQDISEQLQGRLFAAEPTEDQREILERLETTLALIEGWVDHVVARATADIMPSAPALAEAVRRHRASAATHDVFKSLVGLRLSPRRIRDGANLWAAVERERGAQGRDALWQHPDLLPTAADLADPLGYASGTSNQSAPDDWDRGLEELLRDSDPDQ